MKTPTLMLAIWLLPTLGSSQNGAWEHLADSAGVNDYFYDGLWNGERFMLARTSISGSQADIVASTQVRALNANGQVTATLTLEEAPKTLGSDIIQRQGSNESDLMTRVMLEPNQWYNVRVGLDAYGSMIDSTWIYAGVYDNYFAENAVRSRDGGILIALGAIPPGGIWSSIFTLLRLNASGEFAGQTQITDPDLGQNYPYSIIELSPDTILVGNHGLLVENGSPFNFCSLSVFGQDLQPSGGMFLMAIDGSDDPPGPFNTLSSRIHLQQLSGDTILIAGRTGAGGPGSRFAVTKVHWPTTTWLASYLPLSDTPADHPAITQSISVEPDGTILAAYMENYQVDPTPYLPQFPNRVHVVRLDRDLNPICSQVIDGHADNAYYFPYRVKSTPDGGYLVLGGRWNFDEPQMGFAAWARKFEATDCATDLTEIEPSPKVLAYPNPGTDHIIFNLNNGRGYAQAELFDAQGRRCLQTPVLQGMARMDVVHLSAGIYHWRMIDSKGELIGHGNWVKGN